jgi:hypothetical protein
MEVEFGDTYRIPKTTMEKCISLGNGFDWGEPLLGLWTILGWKI